MLFDGLCNLCSGAVDFIIDRDPRAELRFAALQSDAARPLLARCGLPAEHPGSIVLVEDGRCYRRSTAALRIARRLTFPWPLLYALLLVPRPLRDAVYDWVARNRYGWFGKRDRCRTPTPDLRSRFLP